MTWTDWLTVLAALGALVSALGIAYVAGVRSGMNHSGRLWGPVIRRLWWRAHGEDFPRHLWPEGTPDDALEEVIPEHQPPEAGRLS